MDSEEELTAEADRMQRVADHSLADRSMGRGADQDILLLSREGDGASEGGVHLADVIFDEVSDLALALLRLLFAQLPEGRHLRPRKQFFFLMTA